jgi:hypothetical protein
MTQEGYNGWTNYETWNVALWIDNSGGMQHHFAERAQDLWDRTEDEDEATRLLAAEIEQWIDEQVDELSATGFIADILGMAMGRVDHDEIAGHFIGEVDRDSDDDDNEDDEGDSDDV